MTPPATGSGEATGSRDPRSRGAQLPVGWRVSLDASTRRIDGGRALVGGTPLRVLRLTDAGARLVDRLADGEPLPASDAAGRLARRLVDAGLAHPHPPPTARTVGDVAVVIPSRDSGDGLGRTLATVGDAGQVVVVDDGSATPVDAPGRSVVRHDTARGPAAARETGWRATDRPVVAFVDADVELPAGWLAPLLAHLDDPAVGAVAPRVRSDDAGAPPWLAAYERARSSLDLGPRLAPVRPGSRVPYVPTAVLVVRRAALEDVDGLDPALQVGEDVDLVWRLHAAGWRVRYEPEVAARHPSRPTLTAWVRQRWRYGTAAAALADRHGDAVAPLGISGWSALAWALVVAGRPLAGAAVGAGTTAALAPKLRAVEHPAHEAVRIAGTGNLYAGRAVADALRRTWWPLTVALAVTARRTRPALAAAVVVPALLDHRQDRPDLGPVGYGALRLLDDLAYGAGVWTGCWRARSARALRPRFTGRFPRPRIEN